MPYDLEETRLAEYKHLNSKWHDWGVVVSTCTRIAVQLFDASATAEEKERKPPRPC